LHDYLTKRGHCVFFSATSLAHLGECDYSAAIDRALNSATCLIVFGTRAEHLDSGWVSYEWRSFMNEIRSGRKPDGRVFTFISDVLIEELPFGLRQIERIPYQPSSPRDSFETLYRYISHLLN
jgi:hypothetical protein